MSKNNMRVISTESPGMVYHFRGCRYAGQIKGSNRIVLTRQEAVEMGYRPCKCCNNLGYRFRNERVSVEKYATHKGLELLFQKNKLYVKSEMGLWQISYSRYKQKCILYHGNHSYRNLPLVQSEDARYHRQRDEMYSATIMNYLIYIYKHDQYRKRVWEAGGDESSVSIGKKYAAKRDQRMKWRDHHRLEQLFAMVAQERAECCDRVCN